VIARLRWRGRGAGRSLTARRARTLVRDRTALVGAAIFVPIVAAALFAPLLAPTSPTAVQMSARFQGPSWTHPLGTDELGRDLLSRLIYGARVSLTVGALAVTIAARAGILCGLVAAYYGGRLDAAAMRAMDGLLAFPSIILALAIIAALGPGFVDVMIAIGVVYIPVFARITRASVLALRSTGFVEAARAAGASDAHVMWRTLLPNCLSPLLVQITVGFANAILTEAALSFLGLGVQPPTPSWGAMLDMGRRFLTQTAWYSSSAGAAIFLTVLSLNLLGDGLRDTLDPRLHATRVAPGRGQ